MICKKCGKDLPDKSSFCPYCMSKFDEAGEVVKPESNKKNRKTILLISVSVIFVILLIILLAVVVLSQDEESIAKNDESVYGSETTGQESESNNNDNIQTEDEPVMTPLDYCGTWYNKDFQGEDPMTEGGTVLKIMSMTEDTVIFDLGVYQAPPSSRVAEITGIEADIADDKAEFIFGDDGWGNGGIGTIIFMDGEIYVNIKLTTISSDSLWNVDTDIVFKKVDESYESDNIDFMGVVGEQVEVVLHLISDLPYEYEPRDSEDAPYHFGGITIETEDGVVKSILVDYTEFPEGYREKLCFSLGVNGMADYDYMESKLGECIDTYEEDGNYISVFNSPEGKNSFIEVAYSHGEVLSIRYYAE